MLKQNLFLSLLLSLCSISYSQTTPVIWEISGQSSWNSNMRSGTNAEVTSDGYVSPIQANSDFTYRSKMYTSSTELQANSITFKQSPNWDNWTIQNNVGPALATNAPIFLPIRDGEYYFLAQYNDEGGYHAWLSNDMVNWVDQGPVTGDSRPEGYWATSAEYKDGNYYIYYDYPNDQDPHLIIDDDLTDGVVGQLMGRVFNDPSDGSDCGVLRDDADGRFHMVYEDWTPINAREHSWDSPLGGHTSSPDGINSFVPNSHPPVIDHRTTPTGQVGTYSHPSFSPVYYDIHEPDQDAFGDYGMIKVGTQYYIFSDYHPVGESLLRVGKFTSDNINQEFEFTGSLESRGHPDPTVGFAEGQFYLITQKTRDFVSPGPWVDGVEVRVGVDQNGNGTIDTWTSWQTIQESYDHKPGYARVVAVTDAERNLSSLPSGYGFQFEFRVDNSVVSDVSPLMKQMEMVLEPTVINCTAGTPCNDGDACTVNDTYDANCNCSGTFADADNDGVCDADDQCSNFDDNLIGTACDDGDPCTVNDVYGTDCNCAGTTPSNNGSCNGIFTTVISDNFESGWGNWNDGGTHADRVNNGTYSNSGTYSLKIQRNGTTSLVTSDNLNLSAYAEIKVDFHYFSNGMDATEEFWLQMSTDGGSSFSTIQSWAKNVDFSNNILYTESVTITGPFTANSQIRFRNNASADIDQIYLDDIIISGCSGSDPCADSDGDGVEDSQDQCPGLDDALIGTACDDGNPNTINDTYSNTCVCEGTIVQTRYPDQTANIPGTIEAEYYDEGGQGIAHNDDNTKSGTSFRAPDNVDIGNGNGNYVVGWTANGEWLEYTVDVTAGTYDMILTASSGNANPGGIQVDLDGQNLGTIDVSSTGAWGTYNTFTIPNVTVTGGNAKVLRLTVVDGAGLNFDKIAFTTPPACSPGTACDDGDDCTTGDTYDADCNCSGTPVPTGLLVEEGIVTLTGDSWTTVSLDNSYCSMVVVATPHLTSTASVPMVTRIRNANGASFEMRLQNPGGSVSGSHSVSYFVAEEGVFTLADDGIKMEAHRYNSTVTASSGTGLWDQYEQRQYQNDYANPVVLGQVMTYNDVDWSVFWASQNGTYNARPSSSSFAAGKNVAQDSDLTRADETIGVIVFEAGVHTVGDLTLEAGVGADIVGGVSNNTNGFSYPTTTTGLTNAVLSTAGMDGADGGWPILYTSSPINDASLTIAIDEDQIADSERAHTTEEVAFLAIAPGGCSTAGNPCDDGDACTTGDAYDANCNCVGTFADADNDGVCDADDQCPGVDDALAGTACDDGDACTTGDAYDASCNCVGTFADADNDGVCDADDQCPAFDDALIGTTCDDGDPNTVNDMYTTDCNCVGTPSNAGLVLEEGSVTLSGNNWTTVSLNNSYASMVVVATPHLASTASVPMVTRIRNANGSSFEVRLQNPGGSVSGSHSVSYLVAEEGVYTDAADGIKMEAHRYNSTVTASSGTGLWDQYEQRQYQNAYSNPVVVGQVMTYNDADWSVFWASQNGTYNAPPSSSSFAAGKNVAQDSDLTRANETLGVIVFEAGVHDVNGLTLEAGVGADNVGGVTNNTSGFSYPTTSTGLTNAVLSTAGMDGGDGGWPVLYTSSPINNASLTIGIDEDQIRDSERNHTTEQVAYVAFASSAGGDCSSNQVVVITDDFENGYGNWNDGGTNCILNTNSFFSSSGNNSIDLQDNNSTSVTTTDPLDLSAYGAIQVEFTYRAHSMDNANEDFWLQISTDGGSSYTTVEEWNQGDEFENGQFYTDVVELSGPFPSNTLLRFRCDASGSGDDIYIDDVTVYGCGGTTARIRAENTSPRALNSLATSMDGTLNVYPNPVQGLLNIDLPANIYHTIQVVAIDGKTVYTQAIGEDVIKIQVDFSTFRSSRGEGVFLIRFIGDQEVAVRRVVQH